MYHHICGHSFIILAFPVRLLIHFELIYIGIVVGVPVESLQVTVQVKKKKKDIIYQNKTKKTKQKRTKLCSSSWDALTTLVKTYWMERYSWFAFRISFYLNALSLLFMCRGESPAGLVPSKAKVGSLELEFQMVVRHPVDGGD